MADNKIKPLCMRDKYNSAKYICIVTGNDCKIAMDYFKELHNTIEQSKKDGRVFITKESDLCAEHQCPIWHKTIYQINEFAKQNSK